MEYINTRWLPHLTATDLLNRIHEVALRAVRAGLTIRENGETRMGGWACVVLEDENSTIILREKVGDVPIGSRSREFCLEKCLRLLRNGDISSWSSRNPDVDQYGGGVLLAEIDGIKATTAFSGFPEGTDEATVLIAGMTHKLVTAEHLVHVCRISGQNDVCDQLFSHCRDLL